LVQGARILWLDEYGLDLGLGIKLLLCSCFADVKGSWESPVEFPCSPVMAYECELSHPVIYPFSGYG